MSGNMWEWCSDLAGASYRRIRGGCWHGSADNCSVAARGRYDFPGHRNDLIGFRLARSSGN